MTAGPLALLVAALLGEPARQAAPPIDTTRTLTVATGVAPETVTVGDRFRAYVRVKAPAGSIVRFGDLPPDDSLQPTDTVRSAAAGSAGVYSLAAWIAGEPLARTAPVSVTLPGGERREYRVPLRLPVVRSVLPDDGRDLLPRPPKGLLPRASAPPSWSWLLLLPIAAATGLLARWLSRRRGVAPGPDPRAEALRGLDRLGQPDHAQAERFYTDVTRVLREYLRRVDERWGEDLTSEELLDRITEAGPRGVDPAALRALLERADPVKFGAVAPGNGEARSFAAAVRAWIARNPVADALREAA